MYTPFLDIVDQNEDVYDLDYSGNYSHDSPTGKLVCSYMYAMH